MSVPPQGFLWDGALTANQSEGAYREGDKGLTTVDMIPHSTHCMPVKLGRERRFILRDDELYPSYQTIDFCRRYKEDTALMAEMGFTVFQTSIAWSHLYPNGDKLTSNEDGIAFYRVAFAERKKYGTESLVTLYYFGVSIHLVAEYGSWHNHKMVEFFTRYTRACFEALDGLAKYWLTFNEISVMLHSPFLGVGLVFEEGENQDQTRYQPAYHELIINAPATKIAYEISPRNQVDYILAGGNFYPYSCKPEDVWIVLEKDHENLFFINMQARRAYLAYSIRVFRERGVVIEKAPEDDDILKNTAGFVSFSYYASRRASAEMNMGNISAANMVESPCNLYTVANEWGWGIDPLGLCITVNITCDRHQKPLFLVENGLGVKDETDTNGEINDDYRINYLHEHIRATADAIEDDAPLTDYISWGCIDLVSTSTDEMSRRYGSTYVDRGNADNGMPTRTRKKPSWWHKKIIASNGADLA